MKDNLINYRGESNGVHNWSSQNGTSYFWHQSWLHIAEDEMGMKAHNDLTLGESHGLNFDQVEEKIASHMKKEQKG